MYIIKLQPEDKSKPKLYSDLRKLPKDKDGPLNFGNNHYIHQIPHFPAWTKGKQYNYSHHKIDLYNLQCNCDSQLEKRENYKGRDVRLVCKHLYYKILNSPITQEIDSLTLLLMRSAAIWGEQYLYKYKYLGKVIILGFKESTEWINVYSESKYNLEEYHRYSYNPILKRWSYNNFPEYGPLIPDLIKRIIQFQLPFEHNFLSVLKYSKQG